MNPDTTDLSASCFSDYIHSPVYERNVFNFLFKINQMRVDELLHL